MGWEERERGGRYYVQKIRQGKKVTSRQVGTGRLATGAARLDALNQQQRTDLKGDRREAQTRKICR